MKQTKKNIYRIAFLLISLFALLIVYGAYSLNTYGSRWFSSSANTYVRTKKQNVTAGKLLDTHQVILAQSKRTEHINSATNEKSYTFERIYHQDPAIRQSVVHVISDTKGHVSHGAETFMASHLYGFNMNLFDCLNAYFNGNGKEGDTVQLTIDSQLSKYIHTLVKNTGIENPKGAVVVMNYQTGAVLASMSFPNFDPLHIENIKNDPAEPFFNRATQGLYAPGSTFKIITACAALQNGIDKDRVFDCTGQLRADNQMDHVITDAGTNMQENILVSHGNISLRDAFIKSCNNTFAQIPLEISDLLLKKQAMEFGFDDNFLFRDLVVENSAYPSKNRTKWEIAWTGVGQSELLCTPMHMCLIASSIGNDGVMMEPRLIQKVYKSDGTVRSTFQSKVYKTPLENKQTLAFIQDAMRGVVNEKSGTGQAASLIGHTVHGKTGSSEVDGQALPNAWFVGYIAQKDAPYALSIVLENAGSGGSVAAPLAQDIFQYLVKNTKPE